MAEVLKRHGFRKAGLNFSADRSDVTLLVNLQSSMGSNQGNLKVTCNLGIRVDRLSQRPSLSVWKAHWQARIGYYLVAPHDLWWVCASEEGAQDEQEIAA